MAFKVTELKYSTLFDAINTAYMRYIAASKDQSSSSSGCSVSLFGPSHGVPGINRANKLFNDAAHQPDVPALLKLLKETFEGGGGWEKGASLKPFLLEELIHVFGQHDNKEMTFDKKSALNYLASYRSLTTVEIEFNTLDDLPENPSLGQALFSGSRTSSFTKVINIYILMYQKKFLTRTNLFFLFEVLEDFGFEKSETIHEAMLMLEKKELLNAENFKFICHEEPITLADGLIALDQVAFLNTYDLTSLRDSSNKISLAKSIYFLQKANLLSRENLQTLLQNEQHSDGIFHGIHALMLEPTAKEMAIGLNRFNLSLSTFSFFNPYLRKFDEEIAKRFSQNDFDLICENAQYAENFAECILLLKAGKIFNPNNLQRLCERASYAGTLANLMLRLAFREPESKVSMRGVFEVISGLFHFGRDITQDRFNSLLQYAPIFGHEEFNDAFYRLPSRLCDVARIDRWLQICQENEANPTVARTAIITDIHQAINYVPPTQAARANGANSASTFNNSQSTHSASVHTSISASAIKLKDRYPNVDMNKNLSAIQRWLDKQTCSNAYTDKTRAAKAAFGRIMGLGEFGRFKDRTSNITTRELLALVWEGMQDPQSWSSPELKAEWEKSNPKTIPQNVYDRLRQALYECQRGYCLDENGNELENGTLSDLSICTAGTFNKVMETLQTVHLDVDIKFITRELANLLLPARATYVAIAHLEGKAKDIGKEISSDNFNALIEKIKTDGLDPIWDEIKEKIAEEMSEFQSLFSISSNEFEDFINAARTAVDLDENMLSKIRKPTPPNAGASSSSSMSCQS